MIPCFKLTQSTVIATTKKKRPLLQEKATAVPLLKSVAFEALEQRMKVAQTDEGVELQAQVYDLLRLMEAYRSGAVAENHRI